MKIKELIKILKGIDGKKEFKMVDTNDYEYVILDVDKDGYVWIETKEEE